MKSKKRPKKIDESRGAGRRALPQVGEGKRGTQGYLGYLIRQASAAVRGALEAAFAELQATYPQYVVMTMINSYPGISGAGLARLTMLTPQTINEILKNLERAGRLTKRPDPLHGRILLLELTARGKALLEECKVRARKVEARMREGLSAKHEAVVRQWLVEVATRLGETRGEE